MPKMSLLKVNNPRSILNGGGKNDSKSVSPSKGTKIVIDVVKVKSPMKSPAADGGKAAKVSPAKKIKIEPPDEEDELDEDLKLPFELLDCNFKIEKDTNNSMTTPPGEFYFESDHDALRSNSDYHALMRTLVILQAKKIQVITCQLCC